MKKAELLGALAEKAGVRRQDAGAVLDAFVETVSEILESGEKITVSGLGTFEVVDRPARQGINPSTKERIQIPASKSPKFKAAKALKERVKH